MSNISSSEVIRADKAQFLSQSLKGFHLVEDIFNLSLFFFTDLLPSRIQTWLHKQALSLSSPFYKKYLVIYE
jgi:hypothetical protein